MPTTIPPTDNIIPINQAPATEGSFSSGIALTSLLLGAAWQTLVYKVLDMAHAARAIIANFVNLLFIT